jgi:hypothetical protein
MSLIVVDTDIASYIFNWHSSAQRHVDSLRGSELIPSFMSIPEMRMGGIAAGGVFVGEIFWNSSCGVSALYMSTMLRAPVGQRFGLALARQAGPLARRTLG